MSWLAREYETVPAPCLVVCVHREEEEEKKGVKMDFFQLQRSKTTHL